MVASTNRVVSAWTQGRIAANWYSKKNLLPTSELHSTTNFWLTINPDKALSITHRSAVYPWPLHPTTGPTSSSLRTTEPISCLRSTWVPRPSMRASSPNLGTPQWRVQISTSRLKCHFQLNSKPPLTKSHLVPITLKILPSSCFCGIQCQ